MFEKFKKITQNRYSNGVRPLQMLAAPINATGLSLAPSRLIMPILGDRRHGSSALVLTTHLRDRGRVPGSQLGFGLVPAIAGIWGSEGVNGSFLSLALFLSPPLFCHSAF